MPILIGGMIAHLAERYNASHGSSEQAENNQRNGMLCAAGLITGEALIGIFMAVPIVVSSNPDVLALPASMQIGAPLGLAVVGAVVYAMYRVAAPRQAA